MTRVMGHTPEELYDLGEYATEVVSYAFAAALDVATDRLRAATITAAGPPVPSSSSVADDFHRAWRYQVDETLGPMLYSVYESSALAIAYDAAAAYDLPHGDGIPTIDPLTAEDYVASAKNMLNGVGDDTWRAVQRELAQGLERGESVEKLAHRVSDAAQVSQARARVIARTEVNRASNAASYAQARLVGGQNATKEWLATHDGRTRPDHLHADGQSVGIDDVFLVGGWQLRFPGDPAAPPGETVNCRCTLTYDLPDDEPATLCSLQAAATLGDCVSTSGVTTTINAATSIPADVTPADEEAVFSQFMANGKISPAYGGAKIYKHLQSLKKQLSDTGVPQTSNLNEWQLLAIVDKRYAAQGGKSSFTFKFDEWLDTTAGKKATGGLSKSAVHVVVDPTPPPTIAHVTTAPTADAVSGGSKIHLYSLWKANKPVTPGWGGAAIHKNLQVVKAKIVDPELTSLSDEELLKILDEQFELTSKTSGGKKFLTEVDTWKSSPAGQKFIAKNPPTQMSAPGGASTHPSTHVPSSTATAPTAPTAAPTVPTVAPATAVAAPTTPSAAGTAVKSVEELIGDNGAISHFTSFEKTTIFNQMKSQGIDAASSAIDVYQAALNIKLVKKPNVLQIIRVFDEKTAAYVHVPNSKLQEKKLLTWLKTPDGAKKATVLKGGGTLPKPSTPSASSIAARLDELGKLDRNVVSGDRQAFRELSTTDAFDHQAKLSPWTSEEQQGLRHYTGGSYVRINGWLRGDARSITPNDKRLAAAAQRGMRPSVQAIRLYRGTTAKQFGFDNAYVPFAKLKALEGKTLQDNGFMSTSVNEGASFGGAVRLEIQAPPGTHMAFVKGISHYSHEDEMLLAAGTKYRVVSVTQGLGHTKIVVRVVS